MISRLYLSMLAYRWLAVGLTIGTGCSVSNASLGGPRDDADATAESGVDGSTGVGRHDVDGAIDADSGNGLVLVSGLGAPAAIGVDATNIYWAEAPGALATIAKAGGSPTKLGHSDYGALALDDSSAFFLQYNSITKVPKQGGTPVDLGFMGYGQVTCLHSIGDSVYVTGSAVAVAPKSGSGITDIISFITADAPSTAPYTSAGDTSGLYWIAHKLTENSGGDLWRLPLGSTTPASIGHVVDDVYYWPRALVTDDSYVYWIWNDAPNHSTVGKMAKTGGSATTLANVTDPGANADTTRGAGGIGLAADDRYLYFTIYGSDTAAPPFSDGAVLKVDKNGGPVTTIATNQRGAHGVAADASGIYWANTEAGEIVMLPR